MLLNEINEIGIHSLAPWEMKIIFLNSLYSEHGRPLLNEQGEQVLSSKGKPIMIYSKKDFVKDYKNVKYYDISTAESPNMVGDIESVNTDGGGDDDRTSD